MLQALSSALPACPPCHPPPGLQPTWPKAAAPAPCPRTGVWEEPEQAGPVRAAGTGGLSPQTPPASCICPCWGAAPGDPLGKAPQAPGRPQTSIDSLQGQDQARSPPPPPRPERLVSFPPDCSCLWSWDVPSTRSRSRGPTSRHWGRRGCACSVDGTRSWHPGCGTSDRPLGALGCVARALLHQDGHSAGPAAASPAPAPGAAKLRAPCKGWMSPGHPLSLPFMLWLGHVSTPGPGRGFRPQPCPSTIRPRPDPPALAPPPGSTHPFSVQGMPYAPSTRQTSTRPSEPFPAICGTVWTPRPVHFCLRGLSEGHLLFPPLAGHLWEQKPRRSPWGHHQTQPPD